MTREEAIKTLQGKTKTKIASMLELREWLKFRKALDMAIKALEQEPKTGHWINIDDIESECSECGHREPNERFIFEDINYCPNCGARMEGES